jgi:hypothetical protein
MSFFSGGAHACRVLLFHFLLTSTVKKSKNLVFMPNEVWRQKSSRAFLHSIWTRVSRCDAESSRSDVTQHDVGRALLRKNTSMCFSNISILLVYAELVLPKVDAIRIVGFLTMRIA